MYLNVTLLEVIDPPLVFSLLGFDLGLLLLEAGHQLLPLDAELL